MTMMATLLVACKKNSNENDLKTSEEKTEVVNTDRIVSLNGAVTETLVALGMQSKIVGVDVTSDYPKDIKETAKDLGHNRSITAESIIALKPTVVFAVSKDLNPTVAEQIKKASIPLVVIEQEYSVEGTKNLIKEVGEKIGAKDYQSLITKIDQETEALEPLENNPKVLFIYARGTGTMMVAGKETPMDKMIALAGAKNAAEALVDFKPLTPEALLTTNPDVLLLFDSGLQSLGGVEGLLKVEGVAATNAGKNKKVITMNGALLSNFGPRVGEAIHELREKISN